jgi:hypothetical protein
MTTHHHRPCAPQRLTVQAFRKNGVKPAAVPPTTEGYCQPANASRNGPYTRGVPRFFNARLLVVGQVLIPVLYVAGALVPYLVKFTFKGTDNCSPPIGCQAPTDVLGGPVLIVVIPAMLITILGPMISVLLLLGSFTSLARRRREMSKSLRGWVFGSAGLTLAFLIFSLLPPGRLIFFWVGD